MRHLITFLCWMFEQVDYKIGVFESANVDGDSNCQNINTISLRKIVPSRNTFSGRSLSIRTVHKMKHQGLQLQSFPAT
jgi:hypothetical protein